MVKLTLETVLSNERQALFVGPATTAALREMAENWKLEHQLGLLVFEDGVQDVIERITTRLP